jgi:hypothetical protein
MHRRRRPTPSASVLVVAAMLCLTLGDAQRWTEFAPLA